MAFKSVKFRKFALWKSRRAKVHAVLFLVICAHVALVNIDAIAIPSVCPLSFAEQASTGVYGFSALFFLGVYATVLIFGRSICSWACVYGPIQEHCSGMMKAVGINPNKKKFRQFRLVEIITALFWVSLAIAAFKYSETLSFNPMQGYKLAETWVFVGGVITFIPLTLLMTYLFGNRFYCKYLCPIGGTMGLYSRLAPLKVRVENSTCDGCGICEQVCPMGVAIDAKAISEISDSKCIACGECVDQCPSGSLRLGFTRNPGFAVQDDEARKVA